MKKLLFVFYLFCLSAKAQFSFSTVTTKYEQKPKYTHLLVYRKLEQYVKLNGDVAIPDNHWITKSALFMSEKEAIDYINTNHEWGGGDSDNYVSIKENEIIGIFDITTAKEIKVKFIEEKKSKPKRVEIQEEKWVEQRYEIVK